MYVVGLEDIWRSPNKSILQLLKGSLGTSSEVNLGILYVPTEETKLMAGYNDSDLEVI